MGEEEQSTGSGSEEACRRGKSIVTSFHPMSLSLLSYYIYVIPGRQLDHAFAHSSPLVCVLGALAPLERLGCGPGPCAAASSSDALHGSASWAVTPRPSSYGAGNEQFTGKVNCCAIN